MPGKVARISGHVSPQNFRTPRRLNSVFAAPSRKKPGLPARIFKFLKLKFNLPAPLQNDLQFKMRRRHPNLKREARLNHHHGKMPASDNVSFIGSPSLHPNRHQLPATRLIKANHIKSLFQMQRPGLPIRPNATEIENPVSKIRIFLNLAKRQARPNIMYGPRRTINRIASRHRHALDHFVGIAIINRPTERFPRNAIPQPNPHGSIAFRRNHIPHLRLAASAGSNFMFRRVGILRMDLHGQTIVRKNELHQQRKIFLTSSTFAAPLRGHSPPSVRQSLARKRPIHKAALVRRKPSLANRLSQPSHFRIKRRKRSSAPNTRRENRLKSSRRGIHSKIKPQPQKKIASTAAILPQSAQSK